jgi:hypothetical protein
MYSCCDSSHQTDPKDNIIIIILVEIKLSGYEINMLRK